LAVDISPPPPFDPSLYPRTYLASSGYVVFFYVLSAAAILPGGLGVWYFGTGHQVSNRTQQAILVGGSLLFALVGIYLIATILRYRVTLRADAIVAESLFTSRTLLRSDIAGQRLLRTQYVSTLVLVPRETSQKKLKLAQMFKTDAAFETWFADIPDVDAEEFAQSQTELAVDPNLGFSSEERRRQVESAKKTVIALNIATGISFVWGIFFPYPYPLVLLLPAALPLIAVVLLVRSNGIYQMEGRRQDARPSLALVFLLPGMVLAILALAPFHTLHWKPILIFSALFAACLTFVIASADRGLRQRPWAILPTLILSAFYVAGLIIAADSVFDNSRPQTYQVTVFDKHISTGKSTTYYLHLKPWGPETRETQVTVSHSLYNSTPTGEPVCVFLYSGALRVPWYRVASCRR
jgi:hypothetical protein